MVQRSMGCLFICCNWMTAGGNNKILLRLIQLWHCLSDGLVDPSIQSFVREGLWKLKELTLRTLGRKKRTPGMKRPVSGTRWMRTRLGRSQCWWKRLMVLSPGSWTWDLNLPKTLCSSEFQGFLSLGNFSWAGGVDHTVTFCLATVEKASLLGRVMRVTSFKSTDSNPL